MTDRDKIYDSAIVFLKCAVSGLQQVLSKLTRMSAAETTSGPPDRYAIIIIATPDDFEEHIAQ